jgi:hypothetical protein
VKRVTPLQDAGAAAGRHYVMQRRLPTGPATNELEVVAMRPPDELVILTTSGPTPHHADATAAKHLVEGAAVLAVVVADQEAHTLVRQIQADVACLLGHPGPGGTR